MRVIIQPDAHAVTQRAYGIIRQHLQKKPDSVLGLATGSTPLSLYKAMIEGYRRGELDFSRVRTFNLDEYVGLDRGHPQSYFHFMKVNLFDHVNLKEENIHFLDGLPKDVEAHCAEYEEKISAAGGIDVQVLGIGRDGHIGFNEPTSSLRSRTRDKTLTRETVEDNRRFFEREADVPRWALTMGVGTILDARHILLLATGRPKARAMRDMIEGPLTALCPGSALQLHPRVTVVCDESAAAKLDHDVYYRWMEDNDYRMYELLGNKARQ
jgi:glucosamine-6-phosphate deaminase